MSEQNQNQDQTPETNASSSPVESPSSVDVKQEQTTQEHMIPKSRFDEINTKLKALEEEQAKKQKEAEDEAKKRLEEQNEFKKLYETSQKELNGLQSQLATMEDNQIRLKAVTEAGLPADFTTRLQGQDFDSYLEDANKLKEMFGTEEKNAPDIGNSTGDGNAPSTERLNERILDKYLS